jgi:signal transduction histidine kinase
MAPARPNTALIARLARSRSGPGADLTSLCREIAEGLRLPRVALRVAEGGLEFHWPSVARTGRGADRALRELPVLLAGQPIGVLGVDAGAFRKLNEDQSRLLADVVDVLGPVLHLARLEQEFGAALGSARAHAERIAAARRQAFAERDRERRELERDLHDGAQHHLVALRMTVGLLEFQLGNGDLAGSATALDRLQSGIEQAQQTLLSTAVGSCPPALVEHGLAAALLADFADSPQQIRVQVQPPSQRRFPLGIETAAYFTCLEAVNNARKHAPSAQVSVQIQAVAQGLAFAVIDNGPGIDRQDPIDSFGLGNMRARVEAVGGTLELRTALGAGTTVEGFIPV